MNYPFYLKNSIECDWNFLFLMFLYHMDNFPGSTRSPMDRYWWRYWQSNLHMGKWRVGHHGRKTQSLFFGIRNIPCLLIKRLQFGKNQIWELGGDHNSLHLSLPYCGEENGRERSACTRKYMSHICFCFDLTRWCIWISIQWSLLTGLGGPYVVHGIKPMAI